MADKLKLGTIEAAGIKHGAACARDVLAKPDVNAMVVVGVWQEIAQEVIKTFKGAGEFPLGGEAAFQKGFDRGLKSQMENPDAVIQVRGI